MLLRRSCTTCGKCVPEAERIRCETCGRHLHTACEAYERTYDCPTCGEERWIGALEF